MATWMLVEDEPDLYDMIVAMYSMLGVGGVAFVTGEEVFEWIDDVEAGRYDGEMPELALIDIRLPDRINGINVSKRLRASKALGNMALILMTAYRLSPEQEAQALEEASADLLLYKPLPAFNQLQKMLEDVAKHYSGH